MSDPAVIIQAQFAVDSCNLESDFFVGLPVVLI